MPQPSKATRFGGSPAHHNMILANLSTELIRHGRVRTTLAKARAAQPLAERMITFAKRGDLHARRQVVRVIRDRDVVHKLFTDVGPAFAQRNGGYTRLLKLGPRKGDAAPMALLELVEGVAVEGAGGLEEQPRRRWSLRRRKGSTLSSTARETAEERQAAMDRGDLVDDDFAPGLEADHLDEETDDEIAAPAPGAPGDDVQADPAEVEARLAAEEATASDGGGEPDGEPVTDAPLTSEEQDAPAPERLPDEDGPSGGPGPSPSEEQPNE